MLSKAVSSSSPGPRARLAPPARRCGRRAAAAASAARCTAVSRPLSATTSSAPGTSRSPPPAPDSDLAAQVSAAAAQAAVRGAPEIAVELAEHALRLTPGDDPQRGDRILELAGYLEVAGEKQRLTDLLVPALASLRPGAPRARACLLLTSGQVGGNDDIRRLLEQALLESDGDPLSRAAVLAEMSANDAGVRVARIAEAEASALEALAAAGAARPDVERAALYALGWARSLGGRPIDDVCDRFHAASDDPYYLAASPERVAGQRLVWRGQMEEARTS